MDSFLYDHQIKTATYISNHKTRKFIINHGLGSGKTFTAFAAALLNPSLQTIFMTSGGFIELNAEMELRKFNSLIPEYPLKIKFVRWKTLANREIKESINILNNSFIIVDEVHNIRDPNDQKNKVFNYFKEVFSKINSKIIFLTGTPIVDTLKDIDSLKFLIGIEDLESHIGRYHSNDYNDIEYVGEFINDIEWKLHLVKLDEGYEDYLNNLDIDSKKAFNLNASNFLLGKKMKKLISHLRTNLNLINKDKKIYIYSERVTGWGTKKIVSELKAEFSRYNKSIAILEKQKSAINEEIEEADIVVGSNSSSESINIHNVNEIHILTPHWNSSRISQAIGRCTRIDSGIGKKIKVYLHAAYYNEPTKDIKNSVDIYKYWASSEKYFEVNKNFIKKDIPLVPSSVENKAFVIINNYIKLKRLGKIERLEKYEEYFLAFCKREDLNVRIVGDFYENVGDTLEVLKPLKKHEGRFKDIFSFFKEISFEEKIEILENSILDFLKDESKGDIIKLFVNFIFVINNVVYHTLLYKKPKLLAYSVAYNLTEPKGLTKKIIKGNWTRCNIEEELRIWHIIIRDNDKHGFCMTYNLTDGEFRFRQDYNILDKRKNKRGRVLETYDKFFLEKLLDYMVNYRYLNDYLDVSKFVKYKKKEEICQKIIDLFIDNNEVLIL